MARRGRCLRVRIAKGLAEIRLWERPLDIADGLLTCDFVVERDALTDVLLIFGIESVFLRFVCLAFTSRFDTVMLLVSVG